MLPFFHPELKDSFKIWGDQYFEDLPSLVDPAGMYVHVSKVEIVPPKASEFFKTILSSGTHANTTRSFYIEQGDDREKTGNISIYVELSAFNCNFTRYATFHRSEREDFWRWRKAVFRKNLTIAHLS